jgi:ATP synthase protein I
MNKENETSGDLKERIQKARREVEEHAGLSDIDPPDSKAAMRGARAGSAFLGAVIGGSVLGYGIDAFTGITPWGMILMMLTGFVAGVYSANGIMKKSSEN